MTQLLNAACAGKATCNYTVNTTVTGDPAFGSAKDFNLTYTCGTNQLTA